MILKLLLVAIFAFIVQYAFNTLLTLGVHKRVYNHRPGKCRKIEGPVHGSEDIAIVDELDLAFISSGLFMPTSNLSLITWNGQIFVYDLTKKTYKAESVPILNLEDPDNFRPHGISHWMLGNGNVRLFVVNHSKKHEHSVVVLDFDKNKTVKNLKFVKSILDEKFVGPNDIVATGEDSFIISNSGGAQTPSGAFAEILTGFYKGGIVYYDGERSKWLLENSEVNGIIMSRDRKTLFASHYFHEAIGVYKWDPENVEVSKVSEISTLVGCDNYYMDEKDQLWAACHPIMKDVFAHMFDYTNKDSIAASQILRIKFSSDFKTAEMVEVFADDGRFTTVATIATSFDNGRQMLIGTVMRDVTHCDIEVDLDFDTE